MKKQKIMNLGNVEWETRKRLLQNPRIRMWVSPLQAVKLAEGLNPTRSLSEILEPEVDEKYFLSDRLVETLLKHRERHEEKGNGFGANIIACQEASGSEGADSKKT